MKQIIPAIMVFLIIILATSLFVFFGIEGTGLQVSDGFTLMEESSIQITDYKIEKTNIFTGNTRGTSQVIDSSSWKFSTSGTGSESSSCAHYGTGIATITGNDREILLSATADRDCHNAVATAITKDSFKGKKFRAEINYRIVRRDGSAGISISLTDGGTNTILLFSEGGRLSQIGTHTITNSGLIEIKPNVLTDKIEYYYAGIKKGELNSTEWENVFVKISATGHADQIGQARLTIKDARYQPLLSCKKDTNDVNAKVIFNSGTQVNLKAFPNTVKQLCFAFPLEIIRGNEAGIDDSYVVYQSLIQGQTLEVPEGETWIVHYIFDNSEGLVDSCLEGQEANELGACEDLPVLILQFSDNAVIDEETNQVVIYESIVPSDEICGQLGLEFEKNRCVSRATIDLAAQEITTPKGSIVMKILITLGVIFAIAIIILLIVWIKNK